MERGNGNNGNTVLLTVIGVATLLVALVGATFAYFTASVTNNSRQSISVVTAAPGSLEYTAGDALYLPNASPSDTTGTKTMSIENPAGTAQNPAVTQQYDLILKITTNEFNTTATDTLSNTIPDGETKSPATLQTEALAKQLTLTVTERSTTAAVISDTVDSAKTAAYNANAEANGAVQNSIVLNLTSVGTADQKVVTAQQIAAGETQYYDMVLTFEEVNYNQNANQGKNFVGYVYVDNVRSLTTP